MSPITTSTAPIGSLQAEVLEDQKERMRITAGGAVGIGTTGSEEDAACRRERNP